MNSLGLQAVQSLQPTLSPRLQRAVKLLQMSSLDFSRIVHAALDSNPFLETDETDDASNADDLSEMPDAPAQEHEDRADAEDGSDWGAEPLGRSRLVDGEGGVFDTLPASITLADHLTGQLNLMRLSERDWILAAAIVKSLDEDGYLRTPLDDIGAWLPLLPQAQPQELAAALSRVQALEPAGVGARTIAECLQLQLPEMADGPNRELAARILAHHVDALANRDSAGLARCLGATPAAVEAACKAIRRLDPRPGWRHGAPAVQYITPDVIVKKIRGRWTATLNQAVVPRVRLNRAYAQLFNQHRDAGQAELVTCLQEAKWTVSNVEQRFSTILSVAKAILKRQQHFLAYGAMAMKPLALREIAAEVGVHESTVSRVTNNKFMATPCGIYELKYFFSRGLATASGGEASPTAIRSVIQEMIAAEAPAYPLSDVEIARQLGVQGLKVARRTVTKYRQLMKLAPADRRRADNGAACYPAT